MPVVTSRAITEKETAKEKRENNEDGVRGVERNGGTHQA
jgi:hypothetical protein